VKRFLILIAILALPLFVHAQQANEVAHGAEKVSHEQAHPGEEHGGPHEEPKFLGLPAWIWKLVNMLLFLGLLGWLLGGPVKKAFADRTAAIQRSAAEARERREKADQMARDIQERLSRIEGEVAAIHERAQSEGERQKQELIAAAQAEAQKIIANAQSEVENRLRSARTELTDYAGQLAAQRAEQILREKITPEDQKKLFQESLAAVEGAQS
jgi:F-type H+-transporting ATPase subunit b